MEAPRIIVIDHEKAFLDLMCDVLTDEGYAASCWHTDTDTFARLEAANPALAIIDIAMHQRDAAWELLERIHNERSTAHIPVIVCTADVAYVRDKAPQLLKYNYAIIEKPFDIEDMLRQIAQMLVPQDTPVALVGG